MPGLSLVRWPLVLRGSIVDPDEKMLKIFFFIKVIILQASSVRELA